MRDDCEVERRCYITTKKINMGTGEQVGEAASEWRVEPCGTPLFGKRSGRGICKSCSEGWSVATNYPTDKGLKLIAELTGEGS